VAEAIDGNFGTPTPTSSPTARAGPGRGYVEVNDSASEILEELLNRSSTTFPGEQRWVFTTQHVRWDRAAPRSSLTVAMTSRRHLLAYAGPDVTDDLAAPCATPLPTST